MILDNLYWKFGVKKYKTSQEFNTAWKEYTEILAPEIDLNPNATATKFTKILVEYSADWKDENSELQIEIKSQYNEPLKMGEILYALNSKGHDFFLDAEFSYFQGLEEKDLEEEIPVFKMVISD